MNSNNQAALVDCDGLSQSRRHWSYAAIWLAMIMAVLDGVIADIALPTIARDLRGGGAVAAISVINAYQIAVVMLILPSAAAGEIYGSRKVYLAGVSVFALASLGVDFSNFCPIGQQLMSNSPSAVRPQLISQTSIHREGDILSAIASDGALATDGLAAQRTRAGRIADLSVRRRMNGPMPPYDTSPTERVRSRGQLRAPSDS